VSAEEQKDSNSKTKLQHVYGIHILMLATFFLHKKSDRSDAGRKDKIKSGIKCQTDLASFIRRGEKREQPILYKNLYHFLAEDFACSASSLCALGG
jgi:hypothetical protein